MKKNQPIPDVSVIPVLIYPDVRKAVTWLTDAFVFTERLLRPYFGMHRFEWPDATTRDSLATLEWARQWPWEEIRKARRCSHHDR
jgi:hypothetical protein